MYTEIVEGENITKKQQFQFPLLSAFIAWLTERELANFRFFDSKLA